MQVKIKTFVYAFITLALIALGIHVTWFFKSVRFEETPAIKIDNLTSVSETLGRAGWRHIVVRSAGNILIIRGYRVRIACRNDLPSGGAWQAELYYGQRAPMLWYRDTRETFRLIVVRVPSGELCGLKKSP